MKTKWMGWVRGFAAAALLAGCGRAPRAAFQGYAEADFVDVATAEPPVAGPPKPDSTPAFETLGEPPSEDIR